MILTLDVRTLHATQSGRTEQTITSVRLDRRYVNYVHIIHITCTLRENSHLRVTTGTVLSWNQIVIKG